MGTWTTDVEKVKNDVSNWFKGTANEVKGWFESVTTGVSRDVNSTFANGSTVVGINVHQIDNMKKSIREYVNNITGILNKLDSLDPEVAFKGEYAAAVKDYIEAVKTACKAITSNMLAFNDQLTAVKEAYEKKDTTTSSRIHTASDAARSQFKTYNEGQH